MKLKIRNGQMILSIEAKNELLRLEGQEVEVSFKKYTSTRTTRQNSSMHLAFKQIADTLNSFGMDMRTFIQEGIDIPWTQESVKTYLWKETQKTMFGTKSTTELKSNEIDRIFEVIARAIMDRTGEVIEFPSITSMIDNNN